VAKYRLSPRAKQQIRDIWHAIAAHNEPAADTLFRRLFEKFALFARNPEIAQIRPEIAETARLIIEGNYIAIYEVTDYGIEIVAVVHARRDPATWLK